MNDTQRENKESRKCDGRGKRGMKYFHFTVEKNMKSVCVCWRKCQRIFSF